MHGADIIQPWVGESHGVDHPPFEFSHSGCRSAVPRLARHGLGDEAADAIEIDHTGQLTAVAGGASRKNDRISEGQAADVDRESRRRRHFDPFRLS